MYSHNSPGSDVTYEQYLQARLGALLRTATAVCGDPYLAEDIVHDVVIKLGRRWSTIAAMEHRDAYVRRMLVNELVSWRRKWARVIPAGDVLTDETDPGRSEPDIADRLAERDLLDQQLQQLPARQRAVLVLRYLEGLPDSDIAHALGCGESSVRAYASRGLASLRVTLSRPVPTTTGRGERA